MARSIHPNQSVDLCRFATAGSVDDGKSTLIGRLLYETDGVYEDQLEAVKNASEKQGKGFVDLSLLTDGLAAEREQGITIDVAYRYFATPRRRFIIADVPGHEQYTRNMVSGASTADAVIILVDVERGVLPQTRRHLYLARLMRIPHIAIAVNKMDVLGYDEERFTAVREQLVACAHTLGIDGLAVIPVSALKGDMVVSRGANMDWCTGKTVLEFLETIPLAHEAPHAGLRMPVQLVLRPTDQFRGYAGEIVGGNVTAGDELTVLPSGETARVTSIISDRREQARAETGAPVVLTLDRAVDVSRGDVFAAGTLPRIAQEFEATLCWMSEEPLEKNRTYRIKHGTKTVHGFVKEFVRRVNVETFAAEQTDVLRLNDIGVAVIKTHEPLVVEPYAVNRAMGSFIMIDEFTNDTAGAGMIV